MVGDGGPWVPSQDGRKKLVWNETEIAGGRHFDGRIPAPPGVTGPHQSIEAGDDIGSMLSDQPKPAKPAPYYADVAVLAFPVKPKPPMPAAMVTDGEGKALDGATLRDGDLASGVDLARPKGAPPILQAAYPSPQTIRTATLFVPGAAALFTGPNFLPRLEASDDGRTWRGVADIPLGAVPTTVAFAPVTARWFRLIFNPAKGGGFSFAPQAPGVDMLGMVGGAAANGGDGPWHVAFEAGRGAPAEATLPALAPLDQNADPGIKYFSGIAT